MKARFNRLEIAGSLGDLGTLLPLALGLIVVNGLDSTATFLCAGLYYILAGLYFGVTTPVQPMKVVSAYAIAGALSPAAISAAGLWLGVLMLLLAVSGTMTLVQRLVPRSTVRGVQFATGILLTVQGLRFIAGRTVLPPAGGAAGPVLAAPSIPAPVGIVLGIVALAVILVLLDNRRIPAVLVVVAGGAVAGLALGGWSSLAGFDVGMHAPEPLPYGLPTVSVLALALTALALPQLPMTVGNAVMAQADLTREYFGDEAARRTTPRALALSMGLANLVTGFLGGMPVCHGAGGLAAHYRFGARTAGANLVIGSLFVVVAILVGDKAALLFSLLPLSVLGALLCLAGVQLAMMIRDVTDRNDLFVVVAMVAISFVANVGVAFGIGIAAAWLLKYTRTTL